MLVADTSDDSRMKWGLHWLQDEEHSACWCVQIVAEAADADVNVDVVDLIVELKHKLDLVFVCLEMEFQLFQLGSMDLCSLCVLQQLGLDDTWAWKENLQMQCCYHWKIFLID